MPGKIHGFTNNKKSNIPINTTLVVRQQTVQPVNTPPEQSQEADRTKKQLQQQSELRAQSKPQQPRADTLAKIKPLSSYGFDLNNFEIFAPTRPPKSTRLQSKLKVSISPRKSLQQRINEKREETPAEKLRTKKIASPSIPIIKPKQFYNSGFTAQAPNIWRSLQRYPRQPTLKVSPLRPKIARNPLISHPWPEKVTASILQREVVEEKTTEQPYITFEPFGNLTTYAQLVAAARLGINLVQTDLRDVTPGHPVHDRAGQWIEGVRSWLPYLQQQGQAQLTSAAAAQARLHLDEGVAIREEIANAQRVAVQREMNQVAAQARATARRAEQLQPHLNNCLRSAFRSGDSDAISSVTGTLGSVIDIGMGLHSLARESTEAVASFRGIDLPSVGRYVTALDKLNRGLALFNLAFSLTQTEATTQMQEGMRKLTNAAGAFSSLATLTGLPAHMGLYANLYLVPLTQAIMTGISRLTSLLQQENDIWTEVFGEPARYGVEPGGRPMWRFMVSVMKASSAAEVPRISDEVAEYLVEHREALEAGAGEQVPTSGWWFWRDLRTERARNWVFNNRERVWAMFYGSRVVPRRSRRR